MVRKNNVKKGVCAEKDDINNMLVKEIQKQNINRDGGRRHGENTLDDNNGTSC